jgi:sorbitol-specific phosphotransferase system component IIC
MWKNGIVVERVVVLVCALTSTMFVGRTRLEKLQKPFGGSAQTTFSRLPFIRFPWGFG